MRRRAMLAFAGTLLAAPARLLAQPAQKIYRLGAFQFTQTPPGREHMRVFRERLRQLGFAEGRNLQIVDEYSSFDPVVRAQRVGKLVDAEPDLFLSFGSANTLLLQQRSAGRIPVVFTMVGDPVAYGLVKELARPGGNTTGVASLQPEMTAKRLELVREILPKAKRVVVGAYLGDISYLANEPFMRQAAARLGLDLVTVELSGPAPDATVGTALAGGADALFVYQPISLIVGLEIPEKIALRAIARRVPAFFAEPEMVARGGLLSYGPDFLDETRRAADLVARILKGAKAGDLPIDQSSRYELVVNLKTANTLGIEIPQTVRPRIDRIIK